MIQLKSEIDSADLWEKNIELKRNDFLKNQNSANSNLYFVEEGTLRVYILDNDEEHTIRFGYQGSFIASLDSFINDQASEYIIQSLKKCKLKVISKSTFLTFINSTDSLKSLWTELLLMLIQMQLDREKDILISSPKERYLRVFNRSPQLFQEIPLKYIASYLRMTPETLSRLKKY